jgi:hypothetical protein
MPMIATYHTHVDPCTLLVAFIVFESMGYFILWPILRAEAGGVLAVPRRFTVADFVVLLLYVQFTLAFCAYFRDAAGPSLAILLVTAAIGLWSTAVSFLNRQAIISLLQRMLFLLVFLPLTLFNMFAAPGLFAWTQTLLDWGGTALGVIATVAMVLAVVVLALLLRQFAAWFVNDGKATERSRGRDLQSHRTGTSGD